MLGAVQAALLGASVKSAYPWTRTFEEGTNGNDVTYVVQSVGGGSDGTDTYSNAQAHGGSLSCKLIVGGTYYYEGAYILLPTTLDRSQTITFDVWIWNISSGGKPYASVRLCNSSLQGYGVHSAYNSATLYTIAWASRTANTYASSSCSFSYDAWLRFRGVITSTAFTATVYNSSGTQLGTGSLTNNTYSSFDRIFFGNEAGGTIYVDDISVTLG